MVSHTDPFCLTEAYHVTNFLVPSCDASFQYHGGTNFGRTAGGPFVATSYDYDAPIDEYGEFSSPCSVYLQCMPCFWHMLHFLVEN